MLFLCFRNPRNPLFWRCFIELKNESVLKHLVIKRKLIVKVILINQPGIVYKFT